MSVGVRSCPTGGNLIEAQLLGIALSLTPHQHAG